MRELEMPVYLFHQEQLQKHTTLGHIRSGTVKRWLCVSVVDKAKSLPDRRV